MFNTIHDDQNMKYWARRNFSRHLESIHLSIVLPELSQNNSMQTSMLEKELFFFNFNYTIGDTNIEKEHSFCACESYIYSFRKLSSRQFVYTISIKITIYFFTCHDWDLGTVQIICIVVKIDQFSYHVILNFKTCIFVLR